MEFGGNLSFKAINLTYRVYYNSNCFKLKKLASLFKKTQLVKYF